MILRVLSEQNEVLHDCVKVGCSVSWDGYALRDIDPQAPGLDAVTFNALPQAVKRGERVPGAKDADPARYEIKGAVAKLKPDG